MCVCVCVCVCVVVDNAKLILNLWLCFISGFLKRDDRHLFINILQDSIQNPLQRLF